MPNIRSIQDISQKWSDVTQTKSQYYSAGVSNAKNDWATNTAGAAPAWAAGVNEAVANGRFGSGVAKAGTAKWKANTINLGVSRWPQGVANGKASYANGFGPYAQVIQNTTLPPRGPKGSPQNMQRSSAMASALHQAKVGGA